MIQKPMDIAARLQYNKEGESAEKMLSRYEASFIFLRRARLVGQPPGSPSRRLKGLLYAKRR
jgi:hypothetical protein